MYSDLPQPQLCQRVARLGDRIVRYRHRVLIEGAEILGGEDRVWSWVRAVLPVTGRQRAVLTFAGWYGALTPTRFSVEVTTDTRGIPTIANEPAVARALDVIDAGHVIMVQVRSTSTQLCFAPTDPSTVRAWWFGNSERPRPVDRESLIHSFDGSVAGPVQQDATRFETGWKITGEPGGAIPPHVATGRLGHHGRHCRA